MNTLTADQISADIKARLKYLEYEREMLTEAMFALEPDTPLAPEPQDTAEAPVQSLADEAVALLVEQPGLTATELAFKLGATPRYLAKVLEADGRVRSERGNKKAARWQVVES
jgi:hypothetical protein